MPVYECFSQCFYPPSFSLACFYSILCYLKCHNAFFVQNMNKKGILDLKSGAGDSV